VKTAYGSSIEQFKENIKSLRQRMGWTQEEFARQIEVSLSTIQRWESKGAKPTRLARKELERLFKEAGIETGEK
jgi:DNA-binding transcriptional regulator YiaG